MKFIAYGLLLSRLDLLHAQDLMNVDFFFVVSWLVTIPTFTGGFNKRVLSQVMGCVTGGTASFKAYAEQSKILDPCTMRMSLHLPDSVCFEIPKDGVYCSMV